MIVYTSKFFSKDPVEVIADEIEDAGIEDFEVSPKISKTNITISADPGNLKVYIPPRRIYDQYTIESFIRMYDPSNRASMEKEDGYVIMTFPRPIKMKTYISLVEEIIEINGFCTILME